MSGITQVIFDIIIYFVNMVTNLVVGFLSTNEMLFFLNDWEFNIYLFSDTGWFSRPILVIELLIFIWIIFIFIFLIRILWKGTKKFVKMIFGVFMV